MREIKFRCWSDGEMTYSKPMPDIGFWKYVSHDSNTILMQYAGVKDKYNKKIYDGDIVKYSLPGIESDEPDTIYIEQVVFEGSGFCVDGNTPVDITTDWGVEVIGNIHEHKHLLK